MPAPLSEIIPPGTVIELNHIGELPSLEDIIADYVDPTMSASKWQSWDGRYNIRDLIRPAKFNGSIVNLKLEVMAEPYDRLIDASDRGWKFWAQHGSGTGFSSYERTASREATLAHYIGMTLLADAKSSGRGTIGQIQTELWYFPVSEKKNFQQYGGSTVARAVAKPKIEHERFIELHEASRHIGFEVLRAAMMRPRSQPIRN